MFCVCAGIRRDHGGRAKHTVALNPEHRKWELSSLPRSPACTAAVSRLVNFDSHHFNRLEPIRRRREKREESGEDSRETAPRKP